MTRAYDLGNGVRIEDDGHYLRAIVTESDKVQRSIGVKRGLTVGAERKPGTVFKVKKSLGGSHYYLPGHARINGFWLSVKTWPDRAAMEADPATKPGIFGYSGVEISPKGAEAYVREYLSFTTWSVKSGEEVELPLEDPMVLDYLFITDPMEEEQVRKFNEAIAVSGRDYDWIMKKVGAWEPPDEPPVVKLAD